MTRRKIDVKKPFVILLLVSFTVQITGYHLFFHYRQSDIKRAARQKLRQGIDPALTDVFRFPLGNNDPVNGPDWVEENEFFYKGEMYDVIDQRVEGGHLVVRCLSDTREKDLIGHYKELVKKDFGEKAKKRASLFVKLISAVYTPAGISLDKFGTGNCDHNADLRSQDPVWILSEVLTPPPQHS